MPIKNPKTWMPGITGQADSQWTDTELDRELRDQLRALYNPPRASLLRTTAGTAMANSTQPTILSFTTTEYDTAYDGSVMTDVTRHAIFIRQAGLYVVRAQWAWVGTASTSGVRFLGLIKSQTLPFAVGTAVGNPAGAANSGDGFLRWAHGRRTDGGTPPAVLKLGGIWPLTPGNVLQIAGAQNTGATLAADAAAGKIKFQALRIAA